MDGELYEEDEEHGAIPVVCTKKRGHMVIAGHYARWYETMRSSCNQQVMLSRCGSAKWSWSGKKVLVV